MAAIYNLWKEALLQASANSSLGGTVKVKPVTSGYTLSQTHQFLSDISAGSVSGATDQTLASKTYTTGKFTSSAVTYTAVTTGSTINAVILYIDTGTGTTSRLVAYLDGISVVTNGGDVTINPSGSNGWLTL